MVCDDRVELFPHRERAEICHCSRSLAGLRERQEGAQDLSLEDGIDRCSENEFRRNVEKVSGVFARAYNVTVKAIEQEEKSVPLDASGNADGFVFTALQVCLRQAI